MIEVPKTPLTGLPTFDRKQYYRVWRSKELRAVRHAEFEFDKSRGEPNCLYLRDLDNNSFNDQIMITQVLHKDTGEVGYALELNISNNSIGQVFPTPDGAMGLALAWREQGVLQAVDDARPSLQEVAQSLADIMSGKLPEPPDSDDDNGPWAGDIK